MRWSGAWRRSLVLLLLAGLEAWFFRGALPAGRLIGDAGDARLNSFLLEHWFAVCRGRAAIAALPIYHPQRGTLGYGDLLLGLAPPYVALRAAGVDMLLANKLALIAVHAAGSACLYWLLRRELGFGLLASLAGTIVGAYGSAYSVRAGHTQLFAFSLVPPLLIAVVRFLGAAARPGRRQATAGRQAAGVPTGVPAAGQSDGPLGPRLASGFAVVALIALLWYTSYYTAYFAALFATTALTIWAVVGRRWGCRPVAAVRAFVAAHPAEIGLYCLLLAVLLVPLALLYWPALRLCGWRDWQDVCRYLPRWWQLLCASPHNLVYGSLAQRLPVANPEQQVGFPLLTLVLAVAGPVLVWRSNRAPDAPGAVAAATPRCRPGRDSLVGACGLGLVLSMLAIVKWGSCRSAWRLAHGLLPGAAALRAVARYQLILTLPAGLCVAACVDAGMARAAARGGRWQPAAALGGALLCLALALENSVEAGAMAGWTVAEARQVTAGMPAPPAACAAMYLYCPTRPAGEPADARRLTRLQLDAWQIAQHFGLPTLNGYSGQRPPSWSALWEVDGPEYLQAVDGWIRRHDLTGVCAWDRARRRWASHAELMGAAGPP